MGMDFIGGVLTNFTVGNLDRTKLRGKVGFRPNSMCMRGNLGTVRKKGQGSMLTKKVNLNIRGNFEGTNLLGREK